MTTFVDTPLAHCPEQGLLPSTPPPKQNNYLPSPPITPIYRRTVKPENGSQFATWDSTTQAYPTGSPVATVKSTRHSVARPKTPRVTKPRSKTPATAKLSIRRKLAQSHAPPKRRIQKPVAVTTPSPRPAKKPTTNGKNTKIKVKTEFSDLAIINAHPFLQSAKALTRRPKSATARLGKKTFTAAGPGKGRPRGRVTNNSLSTTLHPIIAKRKGIRSRVPGPGKICSSYYPSDRKLVPHAAGQRYHKGQPYLPLYFPPLSPSPVYIDISFFCREMG